MKRLVLGFLTLGMLIGFSGCAGKNFVQVPDDTLVLGQTTSEQISARLGSPYQKGTVTKNDQQMKTSSYTYSSVGGKAVAEGVTAVRSQSFSFFNNKLVGYAFTSSWKEDSTNFDSEKVSQIKKGESTKSDVIRLLGNPGGKGIYPVIPNGGEEAVNYLYCQVTGSAFNLKFYNKQLVVTFNKEGIVTNVEFIESGQK